MIGVSGCGICLGAGVRVSRPGKLVGLLWVVAAWVSWEYQPATCGMAGCLSKRGSRGPSGGRRRRRQVPCLGQAGPPASVYAHHVNPLGLCEVRLGGAGAEKAFVGGRVGGSLVGYLGQILAIFGKALKFGPVLVGCPCLRMWNHLACPCFPCSLVPVGKARAQLHAREHLLWLASWAKGGPPLFISLCTY